MNLYVHFGVVSGLKTTAGNGITAPRVLWAGATVVRDWTESFDDEKKNVCLVIMVIKSDIQSNHSAEDCNMHVSNS